LTEKEDDTKSLINVIHLYHAVVTYGGITREEYDARAKSYHSVRRALDNREDDGIHQI
jgi:hypothetical protein